MGKERKSKPRVFYSSDAVCRCSNKENPCPHDIAKAKKAKDKRIRKKNREKTNKIFVRAIAAANSAAIAELVNGLLNIQLVK